jgi:hypothetical protein
MSKFKLFWKALLVVAWCFYFLRFLAFYLGHGFDYAFNETAPALFSNIILTMLFNVELQHVLCFFGKHKFKPYEIEVSRPERISDENKFGIEKETHERCDCGTFHMIDQRQPPTPVEAVNHSFNARRIMRQKRRNQRAK